MAEYVSPEITTDPTQLAQLGFDYLTSNVPGWTAHPAALGTWMIEATAQIGSEVRDLAVDVPPSIFQYVGATLHEVAPIEAERAVAQSTWTMIDNAGYTIPAGTVVAIPGTDPTILVPFEVAVEVNVPALSTTTGTGAVTLVALEPGAAANGASGAPQLIDPLAYVSSIVVTDTPSGGVDTENNLTYLDRLTSELQLLTRTPVLPNDFAVLARRVPNVWRAIAIDGLIPGGSPETGNARAIAVAAVTTSGDPVDSGTKGEIETMLASLREINFVVSALDPTATTVDVDFAAVAEVGWDAADVQARAVDAVTNYLDPATWGVPTGDDRGWSNVDKVRRGELYAVLRRVPGLAYVETLTLRKGADAFATTDVTLAGHVPVAVAGVISGTVTP